VVVHTLTTSLKVLHDFTSDSTSLLRAIQNHKGHSPIELEASEPEVVDTGNDQFDDFLNAANQRLADFYPVNCVVRTASALEDIANHLARLPGRKNLIWVSGSFPFYIGLDAPYTPATATQERRTFRDEIERASRALNNANLAIYAVDARGLIAPSFANPALGSTRGGIPSRRGHQTPIYERHSRLNSLRD
jgi:VWFA-related protein